MTTTMNNRHPLVDALSVLVLTPHIKAYLEANDPQALRQAECALVLARAASAILPLAYDEMHAVARALGEAAESERTPAGDRQPLAWAMQRLWPQLVAATEARAKTEQAAKGGAR